MDKTKSERDLAMPEGLTAKGKKAYKAIMGLLESLGYTYTGGCKAFYSPKEWKQRGEDYGLQSVLIVVHDGGDLSAVFNDMYAAPGVMEAAGKALKDAGFYSEPCTCWYTAIYEL